MKSLLNSAALIPALIPAAPLRPEPLAYRIPDACHVLGLGKTSIYALMGEGKLRAIKVAGRTLIDAESARALIASAAPAKTA